MTVTSWPIFAKNDFSFSMTLHAVQNLHIVFIFNLNHEISKPKWVRHKKAKKGQILVKWLGQTSKLIAFSRLQPLQIFKDYLQINLTQSEVGFQKKLVFLKFIIKEPRGGICSRLTSCKIGLGLQNNKRKEILEQL